MRVSAKADYAVRAALQLAAAGEGPVKGESIADAQGIPLRFLENILAELRHAGLVQSQRGAAAGLVDGVGAAAVGPGDRLDDRQAKPAAGPRARPVRPAEALEGGAQELGREAGAAVGDVKLGGRVLVAGPDPNRPVAVTEC